MKRKVFLSSTTKDLRDARDFLRQQLESTCKNKIYLSCYERDSLTKPGLSIQEACLSLVGDCVGFIIIFDRYYGTKSEKFPDISITHAELREARKHDLQIIPLVRTETWVEYWIWKNNSTLDVKYHHVEEPDIFRMLDEVTNLPCLPFSSFADNEVLNKIAQAIDAIITEGAVGTLDHVTLPTPEAEVAKPAESKPPQEIKIPSIPKERDQVYSQPPANKEPTPKKPSPKEPESDESTPARTEHSFPTICIPRFSNGHILTADHMSTLFQAVYEAAKLNDFYMAPPKRWKRGDSFKTDDVNGLVRDIEQIYNHRKQTPPHWSFGTFKIGSKFTADHMNELVDSVKVLLETK